MEGLGPQAGATQHGVEVSVCFPPFQGQTHMVFVLCAEGLPRDLR